MKMMHRRNSSGVTASMTLLNFFPPSIPESDIYSGVAHRPAMTRSAKFVNRIKLPN